MTTAATRKSIHDLARETGVTEKKTRRILRSLGRKLAPEVKVYSFNQREFNKALRDVQSVLESYFTECDQRCTHSASDDCDCHCGGENHGIHVK